MNKSPYERIKKNIENIRNGNELVETVILHLEADIEKLKEMNQILRDILNTLLHANPQSVNFKEAEKKALELLGPRDPG